MHQEMDLRLPRNLVFSQFYRCVPEGLHCFSDGLPSGDGALGIRLDISTDKGMRTVFLSRSEAAALHDETVRIQAEIDKLLE